MTNKPEEVIAVLNTLVKTKIAPSPVHGVGVFALYDIPKGTKLYADMYPQPFKIPFEQFDKVLPKVAELILTHWAQIVNGSAFMYPETRICAFMNHSDSPNYDAIKDITLKDIVEEEEIFEDYRVIPNYDKVFGWLANKKD